MTGEDAPPFDYAVNVRTLPRSGREERYEADADVRARLAERNGLHEVSTFRAQAKLMPWKRGSVQVKGRVVAHIVQFCAATGEPLDARVDEPIDMLFVPAGSPLATPRTNDDGELVFDPLGDDLPEPFEGDSIDLASLWCEFLTLGIDPNLRTEGATFDPGDAAVEAEPSPFAVLASLKKD